MKPIYHSISFLAVLSAVAFGQAARAATNEMKVVQFKQGCSILCPKELQALDSTNIERIDKYVTNNLNTLRPKLTFQPKSATTLLVAVDDMTTPKRQVQLALGPPEMSQEDLKTFTPDQTKGLADVMFRRLRPIFAQVGVKVTKELDSQLLDGHYLKCFLLGYEFTDDTKVPQITLRTYYYTKSATFVITFSCEKDYYDKNKDAVQTVLESLNNNGD